MGGKEADATIRHFTDLIVWRKAHRLFLDLLPQVDEFPRTSSGRILADQLMRSSSSISANISEGFNRSRKKFLYSLSIALGEANETENWLYKARDAGFMTGETATRLLHATIEIRKMLYSLKARIAESPDRAKEHPENYLLRENPQQKIWKPEPETEN